MEYSIYCYTNKVNDMKYIGYTHLKLSYRAGRNGHNYVKCCTQFGEAINKYGWDSFVPSILEEGLSKEEAELREQYWISELNTLFPNGYNLESGGKHSKLHPLTKQRISLGHPDQHGKNNPMYGRSGDKNPMYGKEHPSKGKKAFNNGYKTIMAFSCPEGYVSGRLVKGDIGR